MKINANGWDCPLCGDGLYVETAASQEPRTDPEDESGPPDDGYTFWAWEGDAVTCDRCGFRGEVDTDGDGCAELAWDEGNAANIAAHEQLRQQAAQPQARRAPEGG